MITENKETELLSSIGKLVIKYLDYIFVFFVFPFIFDIKFTDPKIFIALGALIVIRAIMPGAKFITGQKSEQPPSPQLIHKEDIDGSVLWVSNINNTNFQSEKIDFPGLGKISTKKVDGDDVLTSFPDFRTIRLKKNELSQLYAALLESEYRFFKPGNWTITIIAKKIS